MAFNSIPEYTTTAATNTDIGGVSIAEGFPATNINNSERQLLAQLKTECALGQVVASASTVDISKIHACRISGTTPIVTFTITDGTTRWLTFAAACQITYDATKMIIQGGASVTMAAGDMAIVEGIGVNQARVWIFRANGQPTVAAAGLRGITGLLPSSIAGTSTTAALTVTAGSAADSTNAQLLTLGSQAWAVSNGNAINGYDGGTTLPNSSTIHFFICFGASGTGTFASTSLTPTFPAGYTTYSRRIFSLTTSVAGALLAGTATELSGGGYEFILAATVANVSAVATTTSAILTPMTAPTGFKTQIIFNIILFANYGGTISSPDSPDDASTGGTANISAGFASTQVFAAAYMIMLGDTSAQIRRRFGGTSGSVTMNTIGFIDNRRS